LLERWASAGRALDGALDRGRWASNVWWKFNYCHCARYSWAARCCDPGWRRSKPLRWSGFRAALYTIRHAGCK